MSRVITIGSLLKEFREKRMNPEGTGNSSYSGITPGTNENVAVPGTDDLSEKTLDSASKYASLRTQGRGAIEEKNEYSLSNTKTPLELTNAIDGTPAELSNIPDKQDAFENKNIDKQLEKAFNILDSLGFFNDLDGQDGPKLNKNSQIDGHSLLNNKEVREKVSGVLLSNRFRKLYNPDKKFVSNVGKNSDFDFLDKDGKPQDLSNIEKMKNIALWVIRNQDLAKNAYPDAEIKPAREDAINSMGERGNLVYKSIAEDTGSTNRKILRKQKEAKSKGKTLYGVSNTPESPYGTSTLEAIANISKFLLVDLKLSLFNVITFLETSSNSVSNNLSNNFKPTNPSTLAPGARFRHKKNASLVGDDDTIGKFLSKDPQLIFMGMLELLSIPIPKHALSAKSSEKSIWKKTLTFGIKVIEGLLSHAASETIIRAFYNKFADVLSPENNFGLPRIELGNSPIQTASALLNNKFLIDLRDCDAIAIFRTLIILGEVYAQSSGSRSGQPYRFSTYGDINKRTNEGSHRHAGARTKIGFEGITINALSVRNIPSLMLLPKAFLRGHKISTGNDYGKTFTPNNHIIGENEIDKLLGYRDISVDSAIYHKFGQPSDADSNRFSKEEVEAMEEILEAEFIPFYFHDLRTNEIISFHAFLNTLNDSFSPSFNASSGFGRIDDVQIYQKTSRMISIDFTVASFNKEDIDEMYFKINKLVSMVYPQYSRGTMLEHSGEGGITRFVQPFSQVTTATPLIRLRVGDLIKSNYSKESVQRLMGVSDPDFIEAGKNNETIETPLNILISKWVLSKVYQMPLNEIGLYDPTKGWPPQSIVIVDPPYKPLVHNDPIASIANSDKSATIVNGPFAVKIISYETFKNPIGGTSPNTEEIMINVQLVESSPIKSLPIRDRIASKNSDGSPIKTAKLSYRDIMHDRTASLFAEGLNRSSFPVLAASLPRISDPSLSIGGTIDNSLFGDENPILKSFNSTKGKGLAGVITSLSFDWGLNGDFLWETETKGKKVPLGCKVSISFSPIHDITPGLDSDGMLRSVYNI